jgi:HAD superfamily phosphoserine phosphatase-like hydrolase
VGSNPTPSAKFMIKAVILDFDGTLVCTDILTLLCGLNGKARESDELMERYFSGNLPGISSLVERINLQNGLPIEQAAAEISSNTHLMPGAQAIMQFCQAHKLTTIINSDTPLPVLETYRKLLGADWVVGSNPKIVDGRFAGITEADFPAYPFKLTLVKRKLAELRIPAAESVAIGDSPADVPMFEFAGHSICINPKHGVGEHADAVIHDDLAAAIPLIEQWL